MACELKAKGATLTPSRYSADYAHYQELAAKAKAHVDHGTAIQTDVLHQAKGSGSEGGEMEPPPSHRTRSKAEGKKRARA